MTYEVIIARSGVPHEDWAAETDTPDQAVVACRQAREASGEHWASDTYEAVPEPGVSDDDALAHAYASAMALCPTLREVVEARHVIRPIVPEWLGMDAMPLSIGGAP